MKRLITLCAATAVAVGLTVGGSPAGASASHESHTAGPAARALPTRPITLDFKQVGTSTKVRLKGKAQDLVGGRVYLQERRSGHWKGLDKTRTDDATRYHFVTKVPKDGHHHKYRVMTAKGGGYKRSFSKVLELYWTTG